MKWVFGDQIIETDDVKSCPFCGQKPTLARFPKMLFENESWKVVCTFEHCMVNPQTKYSEVANNAIFAWNRRS